MTQKALAATVGVSPGAVNAWIKGHYDPSHKTIIAIAAALDVTLSEFYGVVPKARKAA